MAKSLTNRVVQSRRRRPAGLSGTLGIIGFSGGCLRAALALLMIGLVLMGGVPLGSVDAGWAQGAGPSSPAGSATFQSGQITANLATGLQIDHKHLIVGESHGLSRSNIGSSRQAWETATRSRLRYEN